MEDFKYVINFDFEEVNSAVFRNAQLHLRNKLNPHKNEKILVIVPYYFKDMFSNADYLAVITPEILKKFGIFEYRKISDDVGDWAKRWPERLNNNILNKLLKSFPESMNEMKIFLYTKFYYSYRARKYYVNSGLEAYCLDKLRDYNNKFKYLRVSDYFDATTFTVRDFDLTGQFSRYHRYIDTMILDGNLYYYENSNTVDSLSKMNIFSESQINFISQFMNSDRKKVLFRTRNFLRKATGQNSNRQVYENLGKELVKKEILVLNLGCPLLSLDIKNTLYCEVDHNMSFGLEVGLCRQADACVMTAQAGIFHAFATSAITIVQIEEETAQWPWYRDRVSWFQTRKKVGFFDIDIRKELELKDFVGASESIIAGLKNSNHRNFFNPNKPKPKIIEIT